MVNSILLDMEEPIESRASEVGVAIALSPLREVESMLLDMANGVETGVLKVELASAL